LVEGLRQSLKEFLATQKIKGIHIENMDQPISHQKFVDETMLMAQPNIKKSNALQHVLHNFEASSGTSLNQTKPHILFFNTPCHLEQDLKNICLSMQHPPL